MLKVVIIGSGNAGQHLIKAFAKSDAVTVIQAYARNKNNLSHLLDSQQITDDFSSLKEADLYIISVSDEAINEVSKQIPFSNKLVAHTSGSVAMNELSDSNRKGVFYPLQTLSKKKEVDFKQVPLCLEAENESDLKKLGSDICIEHKVPFEILKPLILETAKKVQLLSPNEAQTGPAKRNDTTTINKHLAILTDENQKEIYKLLTKSIIDHGKKL